MHSFTQWAKVWLLSDSFPWVCVTSFRHLLSPLRRVRTFTPLKSTKRQKKTNKEKQSPNGSTTERLWYWHPNLRFVCRPSILLLGLKLCNKICRWRFNLAKKKLNLECQRNETQCQWHSNAQFQFFWYRMILFKFNFSWNPYCHRHSTICPSPQNKIP